jgi:hypothetical protein
LAHFWAAARNFGSFFRARAVSPPPKSTCPSASGSGASIPLCLRHFTYARWARTYAATSSPPLCPADAPEAAPAAPLAAVGTLGPPWSLEHPVSTKATTEAATAGTTRFVLMGSPARPSILSIPSAYAVGGPTVGRR